MALASSEEGVGTAEKSALGNWAWDPIKDDYVRVIDPLPEEAQEIIDEAGGPVDVPLSAEEFARVYPVDTFRQNVAGIVGFFGHDIAKYKSLDLDADDVAFSKTMEVAYRRFLAGDNAVLLKIMSSRDLLDFLIVSAFVAPLAKAVAQEAREKSKAKAMARQGKPGAPQGDPGAGNGEDAKGRDPYADARPETTADLLGGS